MSDDLENDRTPVSCPQCGHDGAFDAFGQFSKKNAIVRPNREDVKFEEVWEEFHCPGCDGHFAFRSEVEHAD